MTDPRRDLAAFARLALGVTLPPWQARVAAARAARLRDAPPPPGARRAGVAARSQSTAEGGEAADTLADAPHAPNAAHGGAFKVKNVG